MMIIGYSQIRTQAMRETIFTVSLAKFGGSAKMIEAENFWPILHDTAIWWSPVVAGFIGAFGVHLLTQSREREKWILDSKKQEFRELLDALSDSYMSTATVSAGFGNKEDRSAFDNIGMKQNDSIRIFSDRIFINNDLPLTELADSWRDAMNKYTYTTDGWKLGSITKPNEDFDKEYEGIKDVIVAAANRAVPKTAWQRLTSRHD